MDLVPRRITDWRFDIIQLSICSIKQTNTIIDGVKCPYEGIKEQVNIWILIDDREIKVAAKRSNPINQLHLFCSISNTYKPNLETETRTQLTTIF